MEDWQGLFVRWTTLAEEVSPASMLLCGIRTHDPRFRATEGLRAINVTVTVINAVFIKMHILILSFHPHQCLTDCLLSSRVPSKS